MSDFAALPPRTPLPAGAHPPEAEPWSPEAAEAWRAAALPGWLRPWAVGWGLAVVLLAGLMLLGSADTGPPCTEDDTCGTQWGGYLLMLFVGLLPYWCVRMPRVALFTLPLAVLDGVVLAVQGGAGYVATDWAGLALFTAGPALALLLVVLRLRARRRQSAVALDASKGRTAPLPKGFGPDARVRRRLGVGVPLVLVGCAFLVWGVVATAVHDARDARATRGTGAVLSRTVVDDGAAEPYDAIGQQLAALPFLLPGIALVVRGFQLRSVRRALSTGEQPVVRMLVSGRPTRQRLTAVMDPRSAGAAIGCRAVAYEESLLVVGGEGVQDAGPVRAGDAVVYGALHEGAGVAVLYSPWAPGKDGREHVRLAGVDVVGPVEPS
ncbi:hypothetical protein OG897_00200 [Streptomyces sp. NBC_00237]|uniref:hypothetical protein n=1 Tax=Streptomyces sp. NBC_00237 TaxID=2975687 RepID=UPI00225AD2C1|nr:hypothetical protein [Streptomyces sp. NBC_00237]MCX5199893.1 hypothetical protein [Streptomyces sp. NBC_00237]